MLDIHHLSTHGAQAPPEDVTHLNALAQRCEEEAETTWSVVSDKLRRPLLHDNEPNVVW